MDLEESDRKRYLILVILAGILFILLFITLIIFIWIRPIKSEDKTPTSEKKLGNYSNSKFSLEDQVNIYFNVLSSLLTSQDSDELFKMLNKDFLEFKSLTKENFREYLSEKNLLGREFTLKEYKNTRFRNENIIKLSFKTNDSDNVSQIVTVFEKSPNDYTISFDNLISYISEEKNYENSGLKVTLSNQTYFSNEYRANIKITNISNSNIILNSQKSAETIYLNQGENVNTIVSNNIFMGQPLTLQPNQSINYSIRFLISEFSFNSIKKIVIKDVTNESTKNIQDIEFDISDK